MSQKHNWHSIWIKYDKDNDDDDHDDDDHDYDNHEDHDEHDDHNDVNDDHDDEGAFSKLFLRVNTGSSCKSDQRWFIACV